MRRALNRRSPRAGLSVHIWAGVAYVSTQRRKLVLSVPRPSSAFTLAGSFVLIDSLTSPSRSVRCSYAPLYLVHSSPDRSYVPCDAAPLII